MLVISTAGLLAQVGPDYILGGKDHIKFVSTPSPTARVNTAYAYTAQAVSSDTSAIIRYSGYFGGGDDRGMNPIHVMPIDSATGVTSWIPTATGWYKISLLAVSDLGGHARQEFNVLVSAGEGTIQGRITDTTAAAIPNIVVRAMKTDTTSTFGQTGDEGDGYYSYWAKSDSNGYYTILHVQPGSYKLRATSPTPDYLSQWYDGQADAASANVVTVADSATMIANFVLRGGPVLQPRIAVTGTVADTLGNPVGDSATRVIFVRAGFALNSNFYTEDYRESFDQDRGMDFRMSGGSNYVFASGVDSLGNYRVSVPVGHYIAFAESPGYTTSFYLNESDFTSADVLDLTADTSGIDFTLTQLPPAATGSISGTVMDSSQDIGVRARVIAFRDHWRQRDLYRVAESYTTDTDSTGVYSFSEMLPGSYIIFALPVGNFAPSYYTTDTIGVQWKRATVLAVNGNTITGVDIFINPLPVALQGYTGITGSIKASDQSAVSGALVYAMIRGQVSGYGIAGSTGNYSINGLAPGTYSLIVDKTGFEEPAPQTTTVTYNNTYSSDGRLTSSIPVVQTLDFSLSQTQTATSVPVSSGQNVVREYKLDQNYPNPFNPSTTIAYALPQAGKVSLKIYNILGQEVANLVNGYESAGVHRVVFNADKLSSGVYFYQLQSSKFVQSKKMVLLK